MGQSKRHSSYETVTNTFIGFLFSLIVTFFVFPLYGIQSSGQDMIEITLIFTMASIVRGYYVRRFYNWLHLRERS